MYLIVNGNKHSVARREAEKDFIRYLTVVPAVDVETLSGTIQMFRDDGFLLSEDIIDNYKRKTMSGTLLVLTNQPEQQPEDFRLKPEYRIAKLESENKDIRDRLAESDEIAIELYEASLVNDAINAEQDEAIIDIYEIMEALTNG